MREELSHNMAPNVMLVICPPWDTSMPPLGLAYLSSSLKKKGYDTRIIDVNIDLFSKATTSEKKLWNMERYMDWTEKNAHMHFLKMYNSYFSNILTEIEKSSPILIGMSINAANHLFSTELAKMIKDKFPDVKICVGGPNSDAVYLLQSEIVNYLDFSVIGEAEVILPQIVDRLVKKAPLKGLNGVLEFSHKENYVSWLPKEIDLDDLAPPTFDEFDLTKYEEKGLPMITSRGCVARCSFCLDWRYRKDYKSRNPINVVEEMKRHAIKHGITHFNFRDLVINGDLKKMEEMCDIIIRQKLTFSWCAQGIVNANMSDKLLHKLKKAGLEVIVFGVESCSDTVLKSMNKPYRIQHLADLLPRMRAAGIGVGINLIIGYPSEGDAEFLETYTFLENHLKYIDRIASLSPCLLIPDTTLYAEIEKYRITWDEDSSAFLKWYTKDGKNDYETRKNRLKQIVYLAKKNFKEIQLVNLYDEQTKPQPLTKKANNMPTIMLVNPPPWGVDNPPTGIAYLSSFLEKKGIHTEVFDFNIFLHNRIPDPFKYLWHFENKNFWREDNAFNILMKEIEPTVQEAVKKILDSNAELIGFSVVDPKERITIELIKRIKERDPKRRIILGGPACSTEDSRKIFIDRIPEFVDAYVINEGEGTLLEILERHAAGKDFEGIDGALTYRNGKYSKFKEREMKADYDFPYPTYKGFNLSEYTTKSLTVEWSRGCVANCVFCKIKGLWSGYRYREPENIVDELEYHLKNNKIKKFTVTDPTFNGDFEKLEKICDLILSRDLKIEWFGQAIPSKKMTLNLLRKMKASGCYKIEYGVESGSNKVLFNMKKPYTIEIIKETLVNTYDAGIPVFIFIMVGFPGEDETEFNKTLRFIEDNRKLISAVKSVNMLHLIDDTDVFEQKEKYGIRITDPSQRHIMWESDNGENTYSVRVNRTEKLIALLKRIGIPLLETNLKEGKERELSISKDDNDLIMFKKKIAEIDGTLYHPAPEKIAARKEPKTRLVLLDEVILGKKRSEILKQGLFTWNQKNAHKTSTYRDGDNFVAPTADSASRLMHEKSYWRDFAYEAGVVFTLKRKDYFLKDKDLAVLIRVYDNSYNQGDCGYSTKVYSSYDDKTWFLIGEFTLNGDEAWCNHIFQVNSQIIRSDRLSIKLDDRQNFTKGNFG
ncbi:MAG: B12-binding domain-containing radical SAM protein, partial [Candidatus Woesearchaeota archaeon]|nr:B12-binding domain-containing radical SAM protein [Candidatus Woesearchaeota archaeon]